MSGTRPRAASGPASRGTLAVALVLGLAGSPAGIAAVDDDAFARILGPVTVSTAQRLTQHTPIAEHRGAVYVTQLVPGPSGDVKDESRDLRTVVRRGVRGAGGAWSWEETLIEPRSIHDEYHSPPSVGVDETGRVHVAYNMHNFPWQYSVAEATDSIEDFTFRGQAMSQAEFDRHMLENKTTFEDLGTADIPGNQVTYPAFFNDRSGRLYVTYRFAARPARLFAQRTMSSGVARYDTATASWTSIGGALTDLEQDVDFIGPDAASLGLKAIASDLGWTAYYPRLTFGPGDELTVSTFWRPGTAGSRAGDPCVLISRDGESFTEIDGSPIALPVTADTCDNVDTATAANYFSTGDVASDAAGTPYLLVSPTSGGREIHRFDGGWSKEASPGNGEEILFDSRDNLWAFGTGPSAWVKRGGADEWEEIHTVPGEQDCYPRAAIGDDDVAYLHVMDCAGNDTISVFRLDLPALLGEAPVGPSSPKIDALVLQDNTWAQVALPFESDDMSPAALFGPALDAARYERDWILFAYDSLTEEYSIPPVDAPLASGVGYWAIQRSGGTVTIETPAGARPSTALGEPRCATALCFGADLAETGDSLVWSMGGYPGFGEADLADLRVIGTAGPCADGCTLAAGYAERQNAPALYQYDGALDEYDTLDEASSVDAWTGFWAAVLQTAEGDLGLLFPAE